MKIEQRAGYDICLTTYTDGWPLHTELKIGGHSMCMSETDLYDLQYALGRQITRIEEAKQK